MEYDDFHDWIKRLAEGDELAAQEVWQRYHRRLLGLAHKRLGDCRRSAAGSEDVVQSALKSFWRGLRAGRFPRLDDELDLWKVLVTITARKAIAQWRRKGRIKHGRGKVVGESALEGRGGIGDVLGKEPRPEIAAEMTEQFERLLDLLEDESLRKIAIWKLEGYTGEEIAREMDCAVRTVKRRLAFIRQKWGQEV